MSFTVTTDVFCDFCSQWTTGYTSNKILKTKAWKIAKSRGWTKTKLTAKHCCPTCKEDIEIRNNLKSQGLK